MSPTAKPGFIPAHYPARFPFFHPTLLDFVDFVEFVVFVKCACGSGVWSPALSSLSLAPAPSPLLSPLLSPSSCFPSLLWVSLPHCFCLFPSLSFTMGLSFLLCLVTPLRAFPCFTSLVKKGSGFTSLSTKGAFWGGGLGGGGSLPPGERGGGLVSEGPVGGYCRTVVCRLRTSGSHSRVGSPTGRPRGPGGSGRRTLVHRYCAS